MWNWAIDSYLHTLFFSIITYLNVCFAEYALDAMYGVDAMFKQPIVS